MNIGRHEDRILDAHLRPFPPSRASRVASHLAERLRTFVEFSRKFPSVVESSASQSSQTDVAAKAGPGETCRGKGLPAT